MMTGRLTALAVALLSPGAPARTRSSASWSTRTGCGSAPTPATCRISNQAGEGFENKIAELLAAELGRRPTYTWYPQTDRLRAQHARRRPVRPGDRHHHDERAAAEHQPLLPLELRAGAARRRRRQGRPRCTIPGSRICSSARSRARRRSTLLAQQGLLGKLKPYQLVVDTRFESPGRQMVEDVADGMIDVGVLWGPIAGYWAQAAEGAARGRRRWLGEHPGARLDFRISMGLRRDEPEWKRQINELLAAHQDEIQAILLDYGVPLLDEQGRPIRGAAEGKDQGALERGAGARRATGMADYRAPVPATLAGRARWSTPPSCRRCCAERAPMLIDVLPHAARARTGGRRRTHLAAAASATTCRAACGCRTSASASSRPSSRATSATICARLHRRRSGAAAGRSIARPTAGCRGTRRAGPLPTAMTTLSGIRKAPTAGGRRACPLAAGGAGADAGLPAARRRRHQTSAESG